MIREQTGIRMKAHRKWHREMKAVAIIKKSCALSGHSTWVKIIMYLFLEQIAEVVAYRQLEYAVLGSVVLFENGQVERTCFQ